MAMIGLGVQDTRNMMQEITPEQIEAWAREGRDAKGMPVFNDLELIADARPKAKAAGKEWGTPCTDSYAPKRFLESCTYRVGGQYPEISTSCHCSIDQTGMLMILGGAGLVLMLLMNSGKG